MDAEANDPPSGTSTGTASTGEFDFRTDGKFQDVFVAQRGLGKKQKFECWRNNNKRRTGTATTTWRPLASAAGKDIIACYTRLWQARRGAPQRLTTLSHATRRKVTCLKDKKKEKHESGSRPQMGHSEPPVHRGTEIKFSQGTTEKKGKKEKATQKQKQSTKRKNKKQEKKKKGKTKMERLRNITEEKKKSEERKKGRTKRTHEKR